MQVEEKPDVTYADVGGCKEQIEKLREVVETPLLHVKFFFKENSVLKKTIKKIIFLLQLNFIVLFFLINILKDSALS